MGRWTIVGVLAALALALAAGCGGGTAELNADERYEIATFNSYVSRTALDGSSYGDLLGSIDGIKALVREKPDAVYETEASTEPGLEYPAERRTLRQVLSDAASTLQPYRPEIAADLDRTVATLD